MKTKIKILLSIILLSIVISFIVVQKIGNKLNYTIKSYATIEAERFAVNVINHSLDQKFMEQLNDDIFETKVNSKGEIQMIDFKSGEVNVLLEQITNRVQKNLIDLENGKIEGLDLANTFSDLRFKKIRKGVVCEIPEGAIYSNSLLAYWGPVVPIKLNFIGQVTASIKTKVETYGINSVYLEVYINVEVKERITMPLRTKAITVDTDIPLSIKVIQGSIPNYYQSPIVSGSSQFSLPVS